MVWVSVTVVCAVLKIHGRELPDVLKKQPQGVGYTASLIGPPKGTFSETTVSSDEMCFWSAIWSFAVDRFGWRICS